MLYQYRWAKPLDRWEGSLSQYQLWDIESKYYEKYGYPIGKYWQEQNLRDLPSAPVKQPMYKFRR